MVGLLVLTPIALWATTQPLSDRFANAAASLASLANITALAGTTIFAVNVALGARIGPIVRAWGSPERMYEAHRRLAVAAFALLLAHALLIFASTALNSPNDALGLFLPGAGWVVFAGSLALAFMAAGLILTLFTRLRHETFVLVQKGLGATFAVGALHALGAEGVRSSRALLLFIAAITALALTAYVYRSVLGRFLARRHRYVVASAKRLDPSTVEIRLEPTGSAISFLPGQFIFVSFRSKAVSREPHPYTLASSPGSLPLEIVVKALGNYTTSLMSVEPGSRADVEGPYGAFSYLNIPNRRQIWIAGGIGVTPLLSMARSLKGSAHEIDFYYCTEGAEHAHYFDELCEIADRNPRLRVIPVRRRSLGRISAGDIVGVSLPVQHGAAVLICGPPAMNENLAAQFHRLGVPLSDIHYEDFSFMDPLGSAGR
jgi:predicted ferric reductase